MTRTNVCGHVLTSILNNGHHPACTRTVGHPGSHMVNTPWEEGIWTVAPDGTVRVESFRTRKVQPQETPAVTGHWPPR